MSRNFEEIAARFWNLPTKGEEEARRESLFMDDIIQKAHLDREVDRLLADVESRTRARVQTVLDAGAGAGRLSIPLARRGLRVTHYDISRPMLTKAQELAAAAGVADRIDFVEGRLTELGQYGDGQFDLVISVDAPVSYTYPRQHEVLRELVRVARRAVLVSVVSRLGTHPYFYNPAQKHQYLIADPVDEPLLNWYPSPSAEMLNAWQPHFAVQDKVLETGLFQDPDQVYADMERGGAPWPVTYAFLPEELHSTLQTAGLQAIRLAGPGALSRSIPRPVLQKLLLTPEHRERFLTMCYRFDAEPSVCGLGKDTLVASGFKA